MPKLFHQFDSQGDVGIDCSTLASLTKQAFKDDCDVNVIVERFARQGEFPVFDPRDFTWGDATGFDFRAALDVVNAANAAFEQMPAKIRNRFNNDPREFVDFCSDKANADELLKLGLAAKPSVEDPKVKVVTVGDLERALAPLQPKVDSAPKV